MSSNPTPPPPPPPPYSYEQIPAGTTGLLTVALKFIAGLTSEKMLLLTVVCGFGYVTFYSLDSQRQREAGMARTNDEARERDQRHCDDREERIRKDSAIETEKMRVWYAMLADQQRRFEAEQRDKDRSAIAELTRLIAKKLDLP